MDSALRNMTHVVECRWPNRPFWESIAAFDCSSPAVEYYKACNTAATNSGAAKPLEYRVRPLKTEE